MRAQRGVVEDDIGRHALRLGDGGRARRAARRTAACAAAGSVDGALQRRGGLLRRCSARSRRRVTLRSPLEAPARASSRSFSAPWPSWSTTDQARGRELADAPIARCAASMSLPAPKTGSLSWPKRAVLLGCLADQHVDDVAGAEALAGAVDGGQRLDRGLGAVPGLDRARGRCRNCRSCRDGPRRNGRGSPCGGSRRSRRCASSALSLARSTRLTSSGALPSSIMRRRCTTSAMP